MRTPRHIRLFGLIVLVAAVAAFGVMHVRSTAQDKPQPPQQKPLTEEQQEKLKERDRLKAEVEKLRKEEKLAEAVAVCEKQLEIER